MRRMIDRTAMPDNRSRESRSALMSRVSSKNTVPEIIVRSLLHSMGYRFRLHSRDLPGKPDIVFRSRRKAIFVHGCFWHNHGCRIGRPPKSNTDFWDLKLQRNKDRDRVNEDKLFSQGWQVITIWQCELSDRTSLVAKLAESLGPTRFDD